MAKSIKKHLYGRAGENRAGGYGDGGKLAGAGAGAKRGRLRGGVGDGGISFGPEGIYSHLEEITVRDNVALSARTTFVQRLGKFAKGAGAPVRQPRPFQHDVFASEAEYNQSVESVVARIKSGQVKARMPDKEE